METLYWIVFIGVYLFFVVMIYQDQTKNIPSDEIKAKHLIKPTLTVVGATALALFIYLMYS